jgi:hypothetical protein
LKISFSVEINAELKALVVMALTNKTEQFTTAMQDSGISGQTSSEVLQSVGRCDQLVTDTFSLFSTAWRIEKYMTENFHYIKPVRVPLGTGEFQHVSIVETLKKINADRSFKKLRKVFSETADDDDPDLVLADLEDGVRLRTSHYFKANPDALRHLSCF